MIIPSGLRIYSNRRALDVEEKLFYMISDCDRFILFTDSIDRFHEYIVKGTASRFLSRKRNSSDTLDYYIAIADNPIVDNAITGQPLLTRYSILSIKPTMKNKAFVKGMFVVKVESESFSGRITFSLNMNGAVSLRNVFGGMGYIYEHS